jgi:hypothetical protein
MPPSIAALEARFDGLSWWLDFWTALLVLALVLECHSLLKAIRHGQWVLVRRNIAGVVVALAVGGELYVQFALSPVESQLRSETDTFLADTNARAEDARVRALGALGKVEELRRTNLELEQMILPRQLSNQTTPRLREALGRFAGTTLAIVSVGPTSAENMEPYEFAFSLSIVDMVGWHPKPVEVPFLVAGVTIWSPEAPSDKPAWSEPANLDDPRDKTWAAAEALRKYLKDLTGTDANHWPLITDPNGRIGHPAAAALQAAGVEMSDSLIVIDVGKRDLRREAIERSLAHAREP